MSAAKYNVVVEKRATWTLSLTWKDSAGAAINLTGYTAKAQIADSAGAVVATLSTTPADGTITLGGAAGTVVLTLPASFTSTLTAPLQGSYDLLLTSGAGVVTRLLEGHVTVNPGVTS